MEDESRIRDIPTIKKITDDVRAFSWAKRAMPIAGPLLRLIGADVKSINEALSKVEMLSREADELARIPDEFNDLFVERGWILYDRMDLEVAKAAIAKAKAGDLAGAEANLVAYHSPENVRLYLATMHSVEAFRPRMALAEKALIDYEEGRYHACVPVVLALLDGMVNEVHQKARGIRRGISAEGVDLSAWDSFAAHKTGLNRFLKILQKTRLRTSTDEIQLPYRNGIMHGIDLGYDNVIVAAKTWALLFATREWAVKAERSELEAPPADPPLTPEEVLANMRESVQRIQVLKERKQRAEAWTPRALRIGRDVARTGPPEAYESDTPERTLAEYLRYWQQNNYGYMARLISVFRLVDSKKGPAEVRSEFKARRLLAFNFGEIKEESAYFAEITATLFVEADGDIAVEEKMFRMMLAGSDGMPAVGETGAWAVVTWTGSPIEPS